MFKGKRGWVRLGIIYIPLMLFLLQACAYDNGANSTASAPTQGQEPTASASAQKTEEAATTAAPTTVAETEPIGPIDYEKIFAYDSSKPMNVKELSVTETKGGGKVHEISYEAYDKDKNLDGEISCYLVEPKGKGPFPAVLYFHWLGRSNSNKDEFLDEATAMADKGVASLLINGYFPWRSSPSELEKDKSMVVYQVIELQRALDYLVSRPNVDPKRIAYVGHDYGSMYGALLSGIDKRIGSYVFVAGMGDFSAWFLQYWVSLNGDERQNYINEMRELDPVNYVKNAAPAKLFFQFANNDRFISQDVADAFYKAASDPKEEKTYDAQHEMESEQARQDRQQWLLDNLK